MAVRRKDKEKQLDGLLLNMSEAFGFSNIRHTRDVLADPEVVDESEEAEDVDSEDVEDLDDIDLDDSDDETSKPEEDKRKSAPNPRPKRSESEKAPEKAPRKASKNKGDAPTGSDSVNDAPTTDDTAQDPTRFILELSYLVSNFVQFGRRDSRLTDFAIEVIKDDPAAVRQLVDVIERGREEKPQKKRRPIVAFFEGKKGQPSEGEIYKDVSEVFNSPTLVSLVESFDANPNKVAEALFVRRLYYADENGEPIRGEAVAREDQEDFLAREKKVSKSRRSTNARGNS